MFDLNLRDKVILITGGSDGLGFSSAKLLSEQGAKIALCGRRGDYLKEKADIIREETKNDVFNIVYTGNYSKKFNDLDLFFASLKKFINNQKNESRPIKVTFVGTPKNHLIQSKIKDHNIEDHCEFLKKIPNIEVKKIQKRASLLLHFAWTDHRQKGILSGKIFEYMSAQKPILSIGFDQELSELIEPYNGKMLHKKVEIIDFLENLYHNAQPIKSTSNEASMISKQNQFRELEQIIIQ